MYIYLVYFRHVYVQYQRYLRNENATLIKSRFDSIFIESFGVELITWATLDWVSQVPYDHIKALFSALKLGPVAH